MKCTVVTCLHGLDNTTVPTGRWTNMTDLQQKEEIVTMSAVVCISNCSHGVQCGDLFAWLG